MITILYSCKGCKTVDRKVLVPEREPEQNVVDWVKNFVTGCISEDHERNSPRCKERTMDNVKIPLGAGRIGDR